MNKNLLLNFCIMVIFNCVPAYRSAMPLNPGELQVSYNAPFSGNVRVGIMKNLQYRISILPAVYETDICYSIGKNPYYALAVGLSEYGKGATMFGFTITASKTFNDRIMPYVSMGYNMSFLSEHYNTRAYIGLLSLGSEIYVFKKNNKKYNIVLLPEVNLWYDNQGIPLYFDSHKPPNLTPWGSLGIGFNYNLKK